ncbi:GAF domain-containing sensor histidine kinase [Actinoplanes sp. NPDC051411]|uniref:sensor histidine kinase n=1 Tax=Actinoplanes sp. NPDC051411 TaxID=3155522 RepID=UPI00343434DA
MEPRSEEARLVALHSYGLLDAARPAVLDELSRLAASVFDTPMSSVTLVDADRQWFAGRTGLANDQDPRDISFCARVVEQGAPLIVPDARAHPVFRDYANVTGRPHIRLYAGAPLIDQDGYLLGTVCVLDDSPRQISDRQTDVLVQLAGQAAGHLSGIRSRLLLADLGDELSRAVSREEDLVAAVSHELRTPVTSIQGYLEMLTEEDELAPYRRYIDPIRRNGERLVKMVDHLLAGTRPADALTIDRTPVDLITVAEAAIGASQGHQAHRDVRCVLEVTGRPAPVRGDFTRLTQAVEQLLRNAIGFSKAGQLVRVAVSFSERAPSVQVIDEGTGIPADELPHVAERFYRGRYARAEAVAGVGLGLSIAQSILSAHGGSLQITSPGPGLGTTARMSLRP